MKLNKIMEYNDRLSNSVRCLSLSVYFFPLLFQKSKEEKTTGKKNKQNKSGLSMFLQTLRCEGGERGSSNSRERFPSTLGQNSQKYTTKVLGHWLVRLLVRSHRSLVELAPPYSLCSRAPLRSLARSLLSLPRSWDSD